MQVEDNPFSLEAFKQSVLAKKLPGNTAIEILRRTRSFKLSEEYGKLLWHNSNHSNHSY